MDEPVIMVPSGLPWEWAREGLAIRNCYNHEAQYRMIDDEWQTRILLCSLKEGHHGRHWDRYHKEFWEKAHPEPNIMA